MALERIMLSRLRPRRLVATALAIVLAVGFVAGTMIFGDTAKAVLLDEYARGARNVDVAVTAAADGRLEPSTLDHARKTAGVAMAAGRMEEPLPLLDQRGRLVTSYGTPGIGINVGEFPSYDVRTGRLPTLDGEAAIDARTAKSTGYGVGDTVTVLDTEERRHTLRIVGTVDISDSSVVVLTQPELVRLTGATGFREIVATVRPGADPASVRDRLPVPAGANVRTGAQLRHDLARQAFSRVDGLVLALQLFAWVAVLVAAFVIYNTFNILVAQRMRETALLRCVGAGRGQVFRLVLVESAVVGLAGAALGIGIGVAVAYGLSYASTKLGLGLPAGRLVLTPWPVVAAFVLGVLVSVVSAFVPAVRATRVTPLAALRTTPLGQVSSRRGLVAAAAVISSAGTAFTVAGLRTSDAEVAMVVVMAGGIGNFLALLVLSPLVIGRIVAALGWLPGRLCGVPARLAVANARRNPGRTAATTAALLVGVALMAGGSTIAATANATGEAQLNQAFPVDYLLTPADTHTIPATVPAQLRTDPAFDLVASVRQGSARLNGASILVGTIEPAAIGTAYRPKITAGRLTDFRPGTAVISASSDAMNTHRVGDRLELAAEGGTVTVTVAAIAQSSSLVGDIVVGRGDFDALYPSVKGESLVMVRVSDETARARLDAALADHPLVQVSDLAAVRQDRAATIDRLVALIAVLLGLTLVIALVGITNTLSLSVLERTRESALTRALGLTRGQLRATLIVEALLMALASAVVGVAFGAVYGWLTAEAAFGNVEPLVSIPVAQLAGFVVLAALAGTLAAVLPSRRAARASVIAALAD